MADLAANTQYQTAGTPNVSPASKYPRLNINPGGYVRAYSPIAEEVRKAGAQAAMAAPFRTGEPLAPPMPAKISSVPANYSSFKTSAEFPYERNANLIAPTAPTIQQLPMGGQWVTEPSQPSSLVKSNREFVTPDEKSRILGALPASLFQVDHIVPLWVGGADSPQNLQVLPNDVHTLKTKVQAVPLTLLAAGKIDLDTAKRLALTWESKDASNIPVESDNGLIPLDTAERVYRQWQDYETRGYAAVPFTQKVKDVIANIPDSARDFGKGWLPDTVREFVKGSVSGATGNILPYTPDEGADTVALGAGFVGNIVGSVWGLGKFAKLISPVLAKTGWMAFNPEAKVIKLASLADAAPVVTKAVPTTLLGKAISHVPYKQALTQLRQNAADNIIRNATVFSTYGMLTESARLGLFSHEEDAIGALTKRLSSDIGIGVITGTLPGTWGGSAGVALGTMVLGQMLGEEPADSLTNAMIMGAFHKWGGLAARRLDSPAIARAVDTEVPKTSLDVLRSWGGKVPETFAAQPAETTLAASPNKIFEWTHQALGKLDNYALAGRNETRLELQNNVTLDQYMQYRRQILTAGRELYKRTLPPAERTAADTADLISLARYMKDKTFLQSDGLTIPNEVPSFAAKAGSEVLVNDTRRPTATGDFSKVSGEMQLTGLGATEINEDIGRLYLQAKAQGGTSPYVLLVSRPDAEPVWRRMGEVMSPEDIHSNLAKPSRNPQNAVQVIAVVKGPNGEPAIGGELGWWPRRFTIDEKQFAFNNQPAIREGKVPRMDPELNKDAVASRMQAEGLPVVLARVVKADIGQVSNKPYIITEINNDTWNLSKDIWGGPATPADDVSAAINRLTQTSAARKTAGGITELTEDARTHTNAIDSLLRTKTADPSNNKPIVAAYLQQVRDVIQKTSTPEQLAHDLRPLGISVDPELAASILARRGDISVRQVLGLLQQSVENNQSGAAPKVLFDTVIRPFIRDSKGTLNTWGETPIGRKDAPEAVELSRVPQQKQTPIQETAGIQPTKKEASVVLTPETSGKSATPADQIIAPAETPTPSGQGRLFDLSSMIAKRVQKGDIPVKTGKSIMKTRTGVTLQKETNPDGSFWLQQNVAKEGRWADFAKGGHTVEHLMLPGNRGYAGKVRIDGKEMTYDDARGLINNLTTPGAQPPSAELKSLLEQAPRKETAPKTIEAPIYQEAKKGLEQIGLGTGRQFDTLPLDMYVDDVIRYIKNYEVPPGTDATRVKQKLAQDAIRLINKEDLDLRAVSMGKSNEAWTKNIRDFDVPKYITAMRDRIAHTFDVEVSSGARRMKETAGEMAAREENVVRTLVEPQLAEIKNWKKLAPTTYLRGYNEAFDTGARAVWGERYHKLSGLMKIMSDKTTVGEKVWRRLLSDVTEEGQPISQPKEYVKAHARGERAQLSEVITKRHAAHKKAQEARDLSRTAGQVASTLPGEDVETSAKFMERGRITEATQSPRENIQDLTRFQEKYQLGLLDEIESGPDPKLSPVRGVEDAMSQLFFWVKTYNDAVKSGAISGRTVGGLNKSVFSDIKTKLRREAATQTKVPTRVLTSAETSLVELKKKLEAAQKNLANVVVSSKHRGFLDAVKKDTEETIAELKKQLTKKE